MLSAFICQKPLLISGKNALILICDTENSKQKYFISKEVLEKKASDETLGWIII